MNDQLVYSATPMTVGLVAIMATFGSTNANSLGDAPEADFPVVIVDETSLSDSQVSSTFGPTNAELSKGEDRSEVDLGIELAEIYASLSEGQEPLGEAFEAIWDANSESLYEA